MPASDYNSLIPQASNLLSTSQNDLLLNFGAIKDLVDVDHVDFADTGAGKHKKVSLPVQSPAPTFGASENGIYSFNNPTTLKNEVYVNKPTGAAFTSIPMTASILSTNANPGPTTPAWTYLPSGFLVKWNQNVSFGGANNVTVNANAFGPNFTNISQVMLTPVNSNTATATFDHIISLKSVSATSFIVQTENGGIPNNVVRFNWLAIGY